MFACRILTMDLLHCERKWRLLFYYLLLHLFLRGLRKSINHFTSIAGITTILGLFFSNIKDSGIRISRVCVCVVGGGCIPFLPPLLQRPAAARTRETEKKNAWTWSDCSAATTPLGSDGGFLLFVKWKAKLNLTEKRERGGEGWGRERGLDWFTRSIGKYDHVIHVTNPCRCRPAKILWLFIEGSFP